MRASTDRILTTHVGSLQTPEYVDPDKRFSGFQPIPAQDPPLLPVARDWIDFADCGLGIRTCAGGLGQTQEHGGRRREIANPPP